MSWRMMFTSLRHYMSDWSHVSMAPVATFFTARDSARACTMAFRDTPHVVYRDKVWSYVTDGGHSLDLVCVSSWPGLSAVSR